MQVLDHLRNGVVLLDGSGRVLAMNRRAQAIINQKDGLTVDRTGLGAALASECRELKRHIALASMVNRGQAASCDGCMMISRPSGREPFWVFVSPASPARTLPWLDQTAVLVFLTDPEITPQPQIRALARFYRLTRAEERLLGEFVSAGSLATAADGLSISRNTAKTQMKQIYAKIGVARQSELVRMIYTMPVEP